MCSGVSPDLLHTFTSAPYSSSSFTVLLPSICSCGAEVHITSRPCTFDQTEVPAKAQCSGKLPSLSDTFGSASLERRKGTSRGLPSSTRSSTAVACCTYSSPFLIAATFFFAWLPRTTHWSLVAAASASSLCSITSGGPRSFMRSSSCSRIGAVKANLRTFTPSLSMQSTSPPEPTTCTIASSLPWPTARMSGLTPSESAMFELAPAWSSASTIDVMPPICAASSGVEFFCPLRISSTTELSSGCHCSYVGPLFGSPSTSVGIGSAAATGALALAFFFLAFGSSSSSTGSSASGVSFRSFHPASASWYSATFSFQWP
mmetsp:Transcript_56065/g.154450  ORF Transcript_56065/g.154450 Transcript_56065/m.154450 type:complete len:317 (-) Transcript_56065:1366-2316(-)